MILQNNIVSTLTKDNLSVENLIYEIEEAMNKATYQEVSKYQNSQQQTKQAELWINQQITKARLEL